MSYKPSYKRRSILEVTCPYCLRFEVRYPVGKNANTPTEAKAQATAEWQTHFAKECTSNEAQLVRLKDKIADRKCLECGLPFSKHTSDPNVFHEYV